MTTWSNLLPEILSKIAGKFDIYEDYINFHCVCSSWRLCTTSTENSIQRCRLPSQIPMLMFAESKNIEDDEEDYRSFFLLSSGIMRKLQLPEARRQRCISCHGWLLTTGEEEFYTKLIHPLSRTLIVLPELYMFEELYFDLDEWIVVFTSSNPLSLDPSFRVIIIWGRNLGFCRPGDASWTRIKGWEGHLFDISYHNMRKRLYVVATMGSIYDCDILNDVSCPLTLNYVSTFPGEEFGLSSLRFVYLLEWGYNSLLMVTRERQYFNKHDVDLRYGPYRTNRFQCFVFGLDDGKWSKLVSLGDKTVFLGFNSSFAINAGGGIKRNCIYFTDDLYEPYRGLPSDGGGDVGVYHMSDGRIEPVFESNDSGFRGSPPLWLQTSTLPIVKEI